MSQEPGTTPTILDWIAKAGLGAGLGALIVEVVRGLFARQARQLDDAARIREELWNELHELRAELDRVEQELDSWRAKYYELLAENAALKAEIADLKRRLGMLAPRDPAGDPRDGHHTREARDGTG